MNGWPAIPAGGGGVYRESQHFKFRGLLAGSGTDSVFGGRGVEELRTHTCS